MVESTIPQAQSIEIDGSGSQKKQKSILKRFATVKGLDRRVFYKILSRAYRIDVATKAAKNESQNALQDGDADNGVYQFSCTAGEAVLRGVCLTLGLAGLTTTFTLHRHRSCWALGLAGRQQHSQRIGIVVAGLGVGQAWGWQQHKQLKGIVEQP